MHRCKYHIRKYLAARKFFGLRPRTRTDHPRPIHRQSCSDTMCSGWGSKDLPRVAHRLLRPPLSLYLRKGPKMCAHKDNTRAGLAAANRCILTFRKCIQMLMRFGFRGKMYYLCNSEEEKARKQVVLSSFLPQFQGFLPRRYDFLPLR